MFSLIFKLWVTWEYINTVIMVKTSELNNLNNLLEEDLYININWSFGMIRR